MFAAAGRRIMCALNSPMTGKTHSRRAGLAKVLLLVAWAFLTLLIAWPTMSTAVHPRLPPRVETPGHIHYLVVAPEGLSRTALAWADYRAATGYESHTVLLAPADASPDNIRRVVQEAYRLSGKAHPLYVLLVGHAHPSSSHPEAFLPTSELSIDTRQFSGWGADPLASDDGFISPLPAEIPGSPRAILIGRIPVRSDEEGLLLLERTRSYEATPPAGSGRGRIELIASNAGFGPQYDPVFEWTLRTLIQKTLPDEYQWHMLYGNAQSPYSYPIETFPNEVARRLDAGALAVVYVGHGQPEMLAWALAPNGDRGPVFGFEDAGLIDNAGASLAVFTACSAGAYHGPGDDLSVVESIFLAPKGPVATYSSSAWINPTLNARLLIDILEAFLEDNSPTAGEWVARVESAWDPLRSRQAPIAAVKGALPWLSSNYDGKPLLSAAQAGRAMDIQNATYNLFGDPALQIAYHRDTIQVSPDWLWQPSTRAIAFSGRTSLPAGQQVLVSLEALPGEEWSRSPAAAGTIERYQSANNSVIASVTAAVRPGGQFSGQLLNAESISSNKYLIRVTAIQGDETSVGAHPVYLGWPPIMAIVLSPVFWWLLVGGLTMARMIREQQRAANALPALPATSWHALRFPRVHALPKCERARRRASLVKTGRCCAAIFPTGIWGPPIRGAGGWGRAFRAGGGTSRSL